MKDESFLKSWSSKLVFIATSILIPILYKIEAVYLWIKLLIIIVLIIVYFISEASIRGRVNKKLINALLARASELKYINNGDDQRVRANIFGLKDNEGYKIKYSFNMDGYDDCDLFIPKNKGVTGESFRTGNQKIANCKQFDRTAEFGLPPEIMEKIPKDLQWICSTPIKDNNDKVIWVMNFDGNKESDEYFDEITIVANKLVKDLKPFLGVK